MSPQMMGKSSRPDKQGIGEIEGGKFTDKTGDGRKLRIESQPIFQPDILDAARYHDLTRSLLLCCPKGEQNTSKYFISNLFSEKITCHSNKYEN